MTTHATQTQPMLQTMALECPFAWKSESYLTQKKIRFFPEGSNPTISFTATRISKILGYLLGPIMGVFRIYNGIQEYRIFNNAHLHSLSNRSVNWIKRGVLESIPVLGALVCMIIDFIATILSKDIPDTPTRLIDETNCGHCHQCGFCKC